MGGNFRLAQYRDLPVLVVQREEAVEKNKFWFYGNKNFVEGEWLLCNIRRNSEEVSSQSESNKNFFWGGAVFLSMLRVAINAPITISRNDGSVFTRSTDLCAFCLYRFNPVHCMFMASCCFLHWLRACNAAGQVIVARTLWRYPLWISVKLPFISAVTSVQGNTATESSGRTRSLLLAFLLSQLAGPSSRWLWRYITCLISNALLNYDIIHL